MKTTTAIIIIIIFITGIIFGVLTSGSTVRTTTLIDYRTTTIHHVTSNTITTQTTITTTIREPFTITVTKEVTISVAKEEEPDQVSLVCFSRPEKCDIVIAETLKGADRYVYVAVYSFTSDLLADELIKLKNRGVDVRVIIEEQQASVRGSEYERLKNAGINIRIDGNSDLMHHKFVVIDDEIVITGSYNWSAAAEDKNDENFVIIKGENVAKLFRAEFERVWGEAT